MLPQLQISRQIQKPIEMRINGMNRWKCIDLDSEDGFLVVHPFCSPRWSSIGGAIAKGGGRVIKHHGQVEQAGLQTAVAVNRDPLQNIFKTNSIMIQLDYKVKKIYYERPNVWLLYFHFKTGENLKITLRSVNFSNLVAKWPILYTYSVSNRSFGWNLLFPLTLTWNMVKCKQNVMSLTQIWGQFDFHFFVEIGSPEKVPIYVYGLP